MNLQPPRLGRRVAKGGAYGRLLGLLLLLGMLVMAPTVTLAVDYVYDRLDRLTSVTFDDGRRINYRYDSAGNVLLVWMGESTSVDGNTPDANFLAVRAPAPNPFNARVELALEIKAAQKIVLKVYDIRGRLVRRLIDEPFEAGVVRVIWDGRDHAGRDVSSGLYLARVRTEHAQRDLKMLLVK